MNVVVVVVVASAVGLDVGKVVVVDVVIVVIDVEGVGTVEGDVEEGKMKKRGGCRAQSSDGSFNREKSNLSSKSTSSVCP